MKVGLVGRLVHLHLGTLAVVAFGLVVLAVQSIRRTLMQLGQHLRVRLVPSRSDVVQRVAHLCSFVHVTLLLIFDLDRDAPGRWDLSSVLI